MKKIFTIIFLLIISIRLFADDGIRFHHGEWKVILSQAKKENKLVFIDVYTTWCGPCKKMVAEVFPQKEVGDLFNASFINYKMDAEKDEGIELAKQFGVRSFPTYLFVNGDGQLVYRTGSYMTASAFLQEAGIALKEKDDPKPLAQWEAEYASGKKDKAFLLGYMKKRCLLKLPSAEIVEELFPLLSQLELQDKEVLSTFIFYDSRNEYVPNGKAFIYVMNNYKMLDSLKLVKYPFAIMEIGINNYFHKKIVEDKQETMLPVMINAYKKLLLAAKVSPADIVVIEKEIPVKYYSGTGNEAKLNPAVIDLVQNGIMKLDIAAKQKSDRENYARIIEPYRTGKADSTKDEKFVVVNRVKKNQQMVSVSYKLRDAAEAVYKNSENKEMLFKATAWAKQAAEWFPHFSNDAVYGALLFKTGKVKEAIVTMETARKDPALKDAADLQMLLTGNIEKMKKGEAPKDLWKLPK